jgi:hypothetical protein
VNTISLGRNSWLGYRVRDTKWLCIYSTQPLIELAKTTSDENVQLVKKVKELEVEVDVWKQAVSSERNVKNNIALCVIDGTRSAFSANYIAQGEQGGKRAGQEIVRAITDYLSDDKSLQDKTLKLSITVFVKKTPLRNHLVINNFCSPEQVDEFFVVLNQTPHLNVIEVDSTRDADKKIEGARPATQALCFSL